MYAQSVTHSQFTIPRRQVYTNISSRSEIRRLTKDFNGHTIHRWVAFTICFVVIVAVGGTPFPQAIPPIPGAEGIPSMGKIPGAEGISSMGKIPGADGIPTADDLTKMPDMDKMPGKDLMDKIPGKDKIPSVDDMPGSSMIGMAKASAEGAAASAGALIPKA